MFLVRFRICVRAIRGGEGGAGGLQPSLKVFEGSRRCSYACAFSYSSSRETFSVINSLAFCKSTIPTFLVWRSHIFIVHETFFYRFSYHQNWIVNNWLPYFIGTIFINWRTILKYDIRLFYSLKLELFGWLFNRFLQAALYLLYYSV